MKAKSSPYASPTKRQPQYSLKRLAALVIGTSLAGALSSGAYASWLQMHVSIATERVAPALRIADNIRMQKNEFADSATFAPVIAKAAVSEVEVSKVFEAPEYRPLTDTCYLATDYGMLDKLGGSSQTFCSRGKFESSPDKFQSSYTYYKYKQANIASTVIQGLRIDMSKAKVVHDISSIAEDGGQHDPRYKFPSVRVLCNCQEPPRGGKNAPRVWAEHLMDDKGRVCSPTTASDSPDVSIKVPVRALLVSRLYDHNPFFQISQTFNTWVMMKVLGWSNLETQIVYLDKGIPSPVDELRQILLAPRRPAKLVAELFHTQNDSDSEMGIVEFDTALVTPYEWTGPMMRHLDDYEPCARSQLMKDFRSAAFSAMNVQDKKENATSCLLTIISRRGYEGRNLQRVWRNEEEVVDRMVADLSHLCTIQAVDFVNFPITEQMRTIVNSDIVVGMHGAGMANIMWTRPETVVIEIFPKTRRRWGYRNLCQQIGAEWHDFRGGEDISMSNTKSGFGNPNKFDKVIPPDEWATFAYPLIRSAADRARYQELD